MVRVGVWISSDTLPVVGNRFLRATRLVLREVKAACRCAYRAATRRLRWSD